MFLWLGLLVYMFFQIKSMYCKPIVFYNAFSPLQIMKNNQRRREIHASNAPFTPSIVRSLLLSHLRAPIDGTNSFTRVGTDDERGTLTRITLGGAFGDDDGDAEDVNDDDDDIESNDDSDDELGEGDDDGEDDDDDDDGGHGDPRECIVS